MSCRVPAAFVAGENSFIMSVFRHCVPHCAAFCRMASEMSGLMSADRGRRDAVRPMRRWQTWLCRCHPLPVMTLHLPGDRPCVSFAGSIRPQGQKHTMPYPLGSYAVGIGVGCFCTYHQMPCLSSAACPAASVHAGLGSHVCVGARILCLCGGILSIDGFLIVF